MFTAHDDADHLDPRVDPLLKGITAEEYCGFATLDAVEDWFRGWFEPLQELGFIIAVYVVPLDRVRYGTQQALFRRGDFFPVKTMPMR